jgi:hypothetical protein
MASDSCAAVAAQIAASCGPVAAAITNDLRRDRAAMLAMAAALERALAVGGEPPYAFVTRQ